jgi:hypothetical protein
MLICEIHITVAPDTDEEAFISFCNNNKIKPIKAVSTKGDYPVQLMTSKYISCANIPTGIERVKALSSEITSAGFKVLRDKLEICCGTEKLLEGINISKEGLYFESHFKIKEDPEDKLTFVLEKYEMTGISVNVLSKTSKMPLVTVRVPCTGTWKELVELTEKVVEDLDQVGVTIEEKKHFELAVYDNFREMDRNWLAYT